MRQFLLASVLIAIPVAGFTFVEMHMAPASSAAISTGSLGDLSAYETIVADTRQIVASGDLSRAEARITDFETLWDEAETDMRPKAPEAWGNVDSAADAALASLRLGRVDPVKADNALAVLAATLERPAGVSADRKSVELVSGIQVTDTSGHALPCEAMLADLKTALANGSIGSSNQTIAADLQAKATERCNADDDVRADSFAAQALALGTK